MAPVLGARRPVRPTCRRWVLRVCPSQGSQGLGLSPGAGSRRGEGTGAHLLPADRAQGHHLRQQQGRDDGRSRVKQVRVMQVAAQQ